jgi:hypothetical protein
VSWPGFPSAFAAAQDQAARTTLGVRRALGELVDVPELVWLLSFPLRIGRAPEIRQCNAAVFDRFPGDALFDLRGDRLQRLASLLELGGCL